MAINATTLRALASAGASAEMIIVAVEAEQSVAEAKAAEKREKNRLRMRAVRAALEAAKSVQNVQRTDAHNDAQTRTELVETQTIDAVPPPDTTACADDEPCAQHNAHTDEKHALSYLLTDSKKDTTVEARKGKKDNKERTNRKLGHVLPDDWAPSEKHYTEGLKLGYTRQGVDDKAEDMRLWAHSNEHRAVARKMSWELTFSGWLRREKPKLKGNGSGKLNVHEAAAKLTEFVRALDEPAPRDLCERAGGNPIRRLSSG